MEQRAQYCFSLLIAKSDVQLEAGARGSRWDFAGAHARHFFGEAQLYHFILLPASLLLHWTTFVSN